MDFYAFSDFLEKGKDEAITNLQGGGNSKLREIDEADNDEFDEKNEVNVKVNLPELYESEPLKDQEFDDLYFEFMNYPEQVNSFCELSMNLTTKFYFCCTQNVVTLTSLLNRYESLKDSLSREILEIMKLYKCIEIEIQLFNENFKMEFGDVQGKIEKNMHVVKNPIKDRTEQKAIYLKFLESIKQLKSKYDDMETSKREISKNDGLKNKRFNQLIQRNKMNRNRLSTASRQLLQMKREYERYNHLAKKSMLDFLVFKRKIFTEMIVKFYQELSDVGVKMKAFLDSIKEIVKVIKVEGPKRKNLNKREYYYPILLEDVERNINMVTFDRSLQNIKNGKKKRSLSLPEKLKETGREKSTIFPSILKKRKRFKDEFEITEIKENKLYLGNERGSRNLKLLKSLKITVIVNCSVEVPNSFKNKFTYFNIPIVDSSKTKISDHFKNFHSMLDEYMEKENERLFVHCVGGISRSATLLISYFMKRERKSLETVFFEFRRKRKLVHPNDGFMEQLLEYEKALFEGKQISNVKVIRSIPPPVVLRIVPSFDGRKKNKKISFGSLASVEKQDDMMNEYEDYIHKQLSGNTNNTEKGNDKNEKGKQTLEGSSNIEEFSGMENDEEEEGEYFYEEYYEEYYEEVEGEEEGEYETDGTIFESKTINDLKKGEKRVKSMPPSILGAKKNNFEEPKKKIAPPIPKVKHYKKFGGGGNVFRKGSRKVLKTDTKYYVVNEWGN